METQKVAAEAAARLRFFFVVVVVVNCLGYFFSLEMSSQSPSRKMESCLNLFFEVVDFS